MRTILHYNIQDLSNELGGLVYTRNITNTNFHSIIEIVVAIEDTNTSQIRALVQGDYELQDEDSEALQRNNQELRPSNYIILAYHSGYLGLDLRSP